MRTAFICLFLFIGLSARSQDYYNDAQIRTHLVVEKKISKKFSVAVGHQARFTKDVSTFTRSALEVGILYKVNKHIRLGADYRFIQKLNKYDYFYAKNWFSGSLILRHEVNKWTFAYRNMLQFRNGNINSDETHLTKIYDRNKLSVKYELNKRLSPYIGGEVYIPLNDPTWRGINRTRAIAGVEITLTKSQQLELYFMYQAKLNNSDWFEQKKRYDNAPLDHYYIYGISYSISF